MLSFASLSGSMDAEATAIVNAMAQKMFSPYLYRCSRNL